MKKCSNFQGLLLFLIGLFFWFANRWFCHFDDDNYVNIPRLVRLLADYSPQEDWYLGKPSIRAPLEILNRDKSSVSSVRLALCGCETWSPTLRDERSLRLFENRVLRRLFGPKRDEVTGEWRKLHNEELNDLYCSPNIVWVMKSRKMRWAGHVARRGE